MNQSPLPPAYHELSHARVMAVCLAIIEASARTRYAAAPNWRRAWREADPDAYGVSEITRRALRALGACMGCGCTDRDACRTQFGPCFWTRPGWCSACAERAALEPEDAQ